jgi:RNA polymerase Rpb5, N-terminal domain
MSSQDELLRLWRINRTCWEMLKDRGYLVSDDKLQHTLDQFKEEHGVGDAVRENMTIVVPKISDPQDQVRAPTDVRGTLSCARHLHVATAHATRQTCWLLCCGAHAVICP